MSPEQQRGVIAEMLGWIYPGSTCLKYSSWTRWIPPKGFNNGRKRRVVVPDYLNDLNAMHEAENILGEKNIRSYAFTLAQVLDTSPTVDLDDQFTNIHATAAQRSEAFLKTLGLWQDEQSPNKVDWNEITDSIYK